MTKKDIDIDNIFDEWISDVDKELDDDHENVEEVIEKYQKQQKFSKRIGKIQFILIGIIIVCLFPIIKGTVGAVLNILLLLAVVYFAYRHNNFLTNLDKQDYSKSVSDFIEQRKEITIEGWKSLKLARYIIYPLVLANSVNSHFFRDRNFTGMWNVVAITFSIAMIAITYWYLEKAIKEFDVKIKSFK